MQKKLLLFTIAMIFHCDFLFTASKFSKFCTSKRALVAGVGLSVIAGVIHFKQQSITKPVVRDDSKITLWDEEDKDSWKNKEDRRRGDEYMGTGQIIPYSEKITNVISAAAQNNSGPAKHGYPLEVWLDVLMKDPKSRLNYKDSFGFHCDHVLYKGRAGKEVKEPFSVDEQGENLQHFNVLQYPKEHSHKERVEHAKAFEYLMAAMKANQLDSEKKDSLKREHFEVDAGKHGFFKCETICDIYVLDVYHFLCARKLK